MYLTYHNWKTAEEEYWSDGFGTKGGFNIKRIWNEVNEKD